MSKETHDISKIQSVIKTYAPDRQVVSVYDGDDRYLVTTKPNDMKAGDLNLDPYYAINKQKMTIVPCDPIKQLKWFLEAKKHKIY